MSSVHGVLSVLGAAASPAEEGRKVIIAMLITGGIFVGVIVLGQLIHWARHRRRHSAAVRRRYS